MDIARQLKFGGKWYKWYKHCDNDKFWAEREAKKLRKDGYLARTYAAVDGWHVYRKRK